GGDAVADGAGRGAGERYPARRRRGRTDDARGADDPRAPGSITLVIRPEAHSRAQEPGSEPGHLGPLRRAPGPAARRASDCPIPAKKRSTAIHANRRASYIHARNLY